MEALATFSNLIKHITHKVTVDILASAGFSWMDFFRLKLKSAYMDEKRVDRASIDTGMSSKWMHFQLLFVLGLVFMHPCVCLSLLSLFRLFLHRCRPNRDKGYTLARARVPL